MIIMYYACQPYTVNVMVKGAHTSKNYAEILPKVGMFTLSVYRMAQKQ